MPHFSFHPGFNGLALLVVVVAASVLVAVFYRRAYQALRPGEWLQLYALRMIAIAIVLLLLFRPVFSFQRETRQRRALVFLIDHSASMAVADETDGGTRLEHATDRVLEWCKKLKDDFEVHLLAFADSTDQLGKPEQVLDLQPTGQATSLSRALAAGTKTTAVGDIEAMVMLSDGIHNSAGDPLKIAGRLGVPVHTVGTGNSLRDRRAYRDVRITGVESPEQLAVDNRARLQGYIDAVGFPGRVVTAVLKEDGKQVDQRELVLDDVEGSQEVTFEFTPKVKGLHTYTVKVPPAPDEKIPQNNERSTSSLVADARIRVLYVEGTLRAEYGALVGRFLARDPNVEFCALVQTRPNVFVERSNIEGLQLDTIPDDAELLETFDVFIIGDLDSTYLQAEKMELIRKRVEGGAGLLMTGGYHSLGPGGYAGTPLDKSLPVFLGDRDVGQVDEPFQMKLTPDGGRHPILANITQFFPSEGREAEVDGLPPLEGCVRVVGAKPGATVLAVHPNETGAGGPMPVLAVQGVGQGRAAAFTGDTTRSWHQTLRTMDRETPFLRFWGQMVRWLAGRSDEVETEAGIAATTDKAYYDPESAITITAVVRGREGEAASGAHVRATITGPGNRAVPMNLAPVSGPAGNFRAVFEPHQSGRYEIAVEAQFDDATLQADQLQVDVGRPNLEFDRLDLDEKMLVAIANQTGGRYAHITTADRLIDRLRSRQQKRQVTYEVSLSWPPLLWVLFLGVLTTEWVLRRKYQLR